MNFNPPEKVLDRWRILKAVLGRSPEVRQVPLGDGLYSVVKWYGFQRKKIQDNLKIKDHTGNFGWIDVSPRYGLAWPTEGSLARLADGLAELWTPSNAHYFFVPMTMVDAGDVVVDVGCCEGAFALECLRRYQASEVWCFEPSPRMAAALAITAERNNLGDRMHVEPAAVSNASGSVQFYETAADPLGGSAHDRTGSMNEADGDSIVSTVAKTTLDDWARARSIQRLDYLKIDAEGDDLAVLEGARECLERWRPKIEVTPYHRPEHCELISVYLRSLNLGYRFQVKGINIHKVEGMTSENRIPRPVMLHASAREGK